MFSKDWAKAKKSNKNSSVGGSESNLPKRPQKTLDFMHYLRAIFVPCSNIVRNLPLVAVLIALIQSDAEHAGLPDWRKKRRVAGDCRATLSI